VGRLLNITDKLTLSKQFDSLTDSILDMLSFSMLLLLTDELTVRLSDMKYKPERDIPDAVRELKSVSPSKIVQWILNHRNVKRSPESITHWFERHAQIFEELNKETVEGAPTAQQQVDMSIFEDVAFRETDSVKNWIKEMQDRNLSTKFVQQRVAALRRICMGNFPRWNINLIAENLWCFKHPDRLELDECRDLLRLTKAKGFDTHTLRMPLRDFLLSKGIVIGKKITGEKPQGFGKYADLKVAPNMLDQMLNDMKGRDVEAYLADKFMYHTGTRINATLNVLLSDFEVRDTHVEVKVFDKARRSKLHGEEITRQGKKWIKIIGVPFYWELYEFAVSKGRTGRLFEIDHNTMSKINKDLIERHCPEVLKKYGDVNPNHFWRHMFAQTNLERSKWNYTQVAFLGGWDVKSLQESYGKPPEEKLREWGIDLVAMVTA
jgi:integrase